LEFITQKRDVENDLGLDPRRYIRTHEISEMKNYKQFLKESASEGTLIPDPIPIESFLSRIGIPNHFAGNITKWWQQNRGHIEIYLFPFATQKPIMGGIIGKNKIAINESSRFPPHIKLFLALHESRHCDQYNEGIFEKGYFQSVKSENLKAFLGAYMYLERDANDFAISSMRDCGFNREMDFEETRLRRNEEAGERVYDMMKEDIEIYNPHDFFDLIKMQILSL